VAGGDLPELEAGAAATGLPSPMGSLVEAKGSHERFGTVALDTYDGRGNIRDAQLEVLFESLRL
jgi:hypothetical protein